MLQQFENNISARGAKVIWAETAEDALNEIGKICKEKNCKTLVKSKSMVTEEIHLNKYLQQQGIESIETDLGEYIQQLDDEPPYHIVTPAMHKSKEDIAKLFVEKLGTPAGLSPQQLTLVAREKLRKKYVEAEVGITGANFLIADTGSISVTENEGNGRLSSAFPKTHIVIAGIEKMIPSLKDLSLFLPLLATFGTGQQLTVYNTIISGPKQTNEVDGPEEMYVILLDNGRTTLLENPKTREALYCIRCGACLNACPVYKNIGGHSYETTYSGPIGSVITPHLKNLKEYKHLSYASSLCEGFKVKTPKGNFFYPDIIVCINNSERYYTNEPVLLVEILSETTRKFDLTDKFIQYQKIPTLQYYLCIEPEQQVIIFYFKTTSEEWMTETFTKDEMATCFCSVTSCVKKVDKPSKSTGTTTLSKTSGTTSTTNNTTTTTTQTPGNCGHTCRDGSTTCGGGSSSSSGTGY
ncbi:unnamed protein product [Adineta steineri]|uniref:4Fe-4S ferredoxin-type domain-containing protein n=1 Tax=Adineta steineri TaxID=433720 RepID=A0A815N9B9_9BILA|nr:unnamed protein product [Adineta steineri]CAF4006537.1 unnamed protein product [Adineta steineri]